MLKLSMGRLFVREEGHLYKRLDAIINRGGLRSVIVRGILKILDELTNSSLQIKISQQNDPVENRI